MTVDFFSCEKHLVNGVSLRITLRRSHNDFVIISEDAAKNYKAVITEAHLFVRKMAVHDDTVLAIEKTLLKNPAIYRYTEVISKTFLATAGQRSWKHENIFAREPIRRIMIAMNTNQAFLGSNRANPFHYQKFGLQEIVIYRNGLPVAGTPISTQDDRRLYYNTINALAFRKSTHSITLSDFPNHYVMVFDLTSTQQATHDFIHPELTNSSITVELTFEASLANNVEILFMGERTSTIFVDSDRSVSKNVMMPTNRNG